MGKKYIRANMATKFIAPYRLFMEKQSFFDPFYTKIGTQSEKKKIYNTDEKIMGSHFNILVQRIVCLFKTKSKKKYI